MSAPTETHTPEPPREHQPGHPYWTQAGPGGRVARGCKIPGCGWFEVAAPETRRP